MTTLSAGSTAATVTITGASGVVGARVLQRLLARPDVDRVIALGRRELPEKHPKLVSLVVDLQSTEAMVAALADTAPKIAICCLGTTMAKAGSREAFRAIDHDAVLAFGTAAKAAGASHLLLVSSIGADPASRNFYLRTKGEVERALAALGAERVTIVRPSFIDPEGARSETRLGEQIGLSLTRAFFAVVGRERRYAPIRAETIAAALVRLAFDESKEPVRVVESDALHALARE